MIGYIFSIYSYLYTIGASLRKSPCIIGRETTGNCTFISNRQKIEEKKENWHIDIFSKKWEIFKNYFNDFPSRTKPLILHLFPYFWKRTWGLLDTIIQYKLCGSGFTSPV